MTSRRMQEDGMSDERVEIMARAMYEDWFAPVRLTWEMQDDVMRDKHRSEAAAALAALESAGYAVVKLQAVTFMDAYEVGCSALKEDLDNPAPLYRKLPLASDPR